MKSLKINLRLWITLTSFLSFLGGWVLLSHAGKPVPFIQTPAVDPASVISSQIDTSLLTPVPSVQDLFTNNNNLSPIPVIPRLPSQSFFPRLRTRGS
jgi:hypothetical protein